MYLRTTKRTNKDGSVVTYYQLAHNERDPVTRKPVAKIIHSFGRADKLDRNELVRLCRSIARICKVEVIDPLDEAQLPLTTTVGLPLDLKLHSTNELTGNVRKLLKCLKISHPKPIQGIQKHSENV